MRSILQIIASTDRRGAETFAVDLERALASPSLHIETLALTQGAGAGLDVRVLGTRPFSLRTLRALREAARGRDLVIAHGSATLPACALALRSAPPFVYRNIGDPSYWVDSRRKALWVRRALRRAAAVTALWDQGADRLAALGVARERISVIPNGVPLSRCDFDHHAVGQATRAELAIGPDVAVVVSVGALSAEKAVDRAVRAVSGISEAHLLVVGDGPERPALSVLARQLMPGRVHFTGSTDRAAEYIAAADVALLTSRTEGMPGFLIEAGMIGVPAVATDVGAVREVVVHGRTGFLVPPDDPGGFEARLRTLLGAPDAFGTAARAHCIDHFEIATVAHSWHQLIGEVQGGRRW